MLVPNFKAVGETQVELHTLEVDKMDTCIRQDTFLQIRSHIENTLIEQIGPT